MTVRDDTRDRSRPTVVRHPQIKLIPKPAIVVRALACAMNVARSRRICLFTDADLPRHFEAEKPCSTYITPSPRAPCTLAIGSDDSRPLRGECKPNDSLFIVRPSDVSSKPASADVMRADFSRHAMRLQSFSPTSGRNRIFHLQKSERGDSI